jgi:hypothetical protein
VNPTPAGSQPPTSPVLGAWQPLPNAGAAPHDTDDKSKKTINRWIARGFLVVIMTGCVSVGTWSIYTLLTGNLHAPTGIGLLGAGVFDVAALYFAYLGQQYATSMDSGLGPRIAMLCVISLSVYINWTHAQIAGWGSIGGIVLAAPSVVAEVAFEMWHKFEHRDALRRLGRVAQTLPVIGKWAWLFHPIRSRKTIDAHIRAGLTEHEAVASRREELADVRARLTVSLPIAAPEVSLTGFGPAAVSLERIETAALETSRGETSRPETTETPVSETRETRETETAKRPVDRSPETKTTGETGETETGLRVSRPGLPRETTQVTGIGDRETETRQLLDLMKSRGGHMEVSLNDAIETTGRPKATAAKRLKTARDQYLAETA